MLFRCEIPLVLSGLGIKAKLRGAEHWACCPIHGEKNPSWSIKDDFGSRKHGWWSCFSCGASGDVASLVSSVLAIDRKSALVWLTDCARVSIPSRVDVCVVANRVNLTTPQEVVFEPLHKWPKKFGAYLGSRGVTWEQVERWGIGYIVDGKYRDRIWFPVCGVGGVLRTWTARHIGVGIRYLTASRSDGAETDAIFGMDWWGDQNRVVIVEGIFDALAVERRWPKEAVAALLGARISTWHQMALSRFPVAIVATDSDHAGDRVAGEIAGMRHWDSVFRIRPPDGLDMSDLITT